MTSLVLDRLTLPTLEALRDEFTVASAIDPDFFALNCTIVHDIELDNGEPITPIHDALNWGKLSRFTHQARSLIGVHISSARLATYQVKVYSEKLTNKGKSGQYYAPIPDRSSIKGENDRVFFAKVPQWFCEQVAYRYGLEPPVCDLFWNWVELHPQVEIIITEGVKKALSLLSHGYVAVSLYGCRSGYNPATRMVRKDLLALAKHRSRVTIAFDRDVKETAIKAVKAGINRLAPALKRSGTKLVDIACWNPELGKGVDDLFKNDPLYFEEALVKATPFSAFLTLQELTSLERFKPVSISERYFPQTYDFPATAKIIGLKGRKKTGKTECIASLVKKAQSIGQRVYIVTHRIQLAKNLCQRYGLNHLKDLKQLHNPEGKIFGYGLCIDSLRASSQANFQPDEFVDALVIIDEADEVFAHLLISDTLAKHGRRVEVLLTFEDALKSCLESEHGKIFLMSADLSAKEINFCADMVERRPEIFVLENSFKPIEGKRKAYIYNSEAHLTSCLIQAIQAGEKPIIQLSSQQSKYKWSTTTLEKSLAKEFPTHKILRIDSQSISDSYHPAYGCMENLDHVLAQYDVVIASPTIETGVSIELTGHFNSVWVIANGTQSVNAACQTPERLRADVDRHIYVTNTSKQRIGNGATFAQGLCEYNAKKSKFNLEGMRDVLEAQQYSQAKGNKGQFVQTWSEIAAQFNFGFVHYGEIFLEKLKDEGYQLYFLEQEDKQLSRNTDANAKETSKLLYRKHCQAVADAPNPSDERYRELEEKQTKTKAERELLDKGTICRLYLSEEVSPELVAQHEDGLYQKQDRLYSLFEGNPYLENRDLNRLDNSTYNSQYFEPDLNKNLKSLEIKTLEIVLKPLINSETIYTKETLSQWFETKILPYRQDLRDYLGLTVSLDTQKDNAIRTLQRLLKMVGLELTKLDKRKGQTRQYQLDPSKLTEHQDIRNRWLQRDLAKFSDITLTIDTNKQVMPLLIKEPLDPEVKEIKDILSGLDYTKREDFLTFERINSDFTKESIEDAIDYLEDTKQKTTLKQWLSELKTGLRIGAKVILDGIEHILVDFKDSLQAILRACGTEIELVVGIERIRLVS